VKTIAQVLEGKTAPIATIEADSTVLDALKLLAERSIGAVLVMRDGALAGIFSERDYADGSCCRARALRKHRSRRDDLSRLTTITPTTTVEEAMQLMTDKRIRHLPVLDAAGTLIGVVSIGDMVKETIAYQQFLIKQLESYISS
jgi:CBS domain-containing protein